MNDLFVDSLDFAKYNFRTQINLFGWFNANARILDVILLSLRNHLLVILAQFHGILGRFLKKRYSQ